MKKSISVIAIILSMVMVLASCGTNQNGKDEEPVSTPDPELVKNTVNATIELEDGDEIMLELYPDLAPDTVENFVELAEDGFYPSSHISEYDWKKLLSNTSVEITATVWDAEWNFYNWAYGGPVNYSDVKESLRILGINPLEFKKAFDDSSVSLGGSHRLRGYFPDMPNRKPAVDVNELRGNMIVLYDGVLNFCLGDLAQVAEVVSGETKNITFKKGTNVVMYDFGNGAGITEVQLKEDVTIPRKKVEFKNDNESRYGIQSCYGFVHSYWTEGSVQNG